MSRDRTALFLSARLFVVIIAPALALAATILLSRALPGGAQLSYRGGSQERSALYLYDVVHHIERQLPTRPSELYLPRWSADGSHFSFIEKDDVPTSSDVIVQYAPRGNVLRAYVPPLTMPMSIQIPPASSGATRELFFGIGAVAAGPHATTNLAWVNTGQEVRVHTIDDLPSQFTTMHHLGDNLLRIATVRSRNMIVYDIQLPDFEFVREQRWDARFTDASRPVFSPDMSSVVLSAAQPGSSSYDLYRFDIGSEEIFRLTDVRTANETHPAWSPDGAQIAYRHIADGPQFIYVINRDGSGARVVYQHPTARIHELHWSPSGDMLAFLIAQPGQHELCILRFADETSTCPVRSERLDEVAWRPRSG